MAAPRMAKQRSPVNLFLPEAEVELEIEGFSRVRIGQTDPLLMAKQLFLVAKKSSLPQSKSSAIELLYSSTTNCGNPPEKGPRIFENPTRVPRWFRSQALQRFGGVDHKLT